ncbi:MAG: ATP-binding protein [Aquabacterium sp.]
MPPETSYLFGSWRLVPAQRALLSDGQAIKIGSRALDVLQTLIERRERVVSKDELMALAWPGVVVEENNLQVQVVTLRKLLGHPAIATVPGRGYRFTLAVQVDGMGDAPPTVHAWAPSPVVAGAAADLVGRDEDVAALLDLVQRHALVTVAGAGGIGKTRLAQSVMRAAAPAMPHGTCWVELAPLTDVGQLVGALARSIGLSVDGAADQVQALAQALNGRTLLLVLDNAEHLLEGVVPLVNALRTAAPKLRMLVTSQEVLRLPDEHVFRVAPLGLPLRAELAEAGASGAVQLFVARAAAVSSGFRLTTDNVAAVVDICRRLDGIPLAIELAAARVRLLGVDGLRRRLDERFNVLTGGARVAMRRHQTLRAALEWSYGLLDDAEKAVFRQLGVFVGGFSLDAAQAAAETDSVDRWDVLEHLGSLVDKSLVMVQGSSLPRYHLLESTRLFLLERLAESGETEEALRQHAHAMVDAMAGRDRGWQRWLDGGEAFAAHAAEVANARVAVEWARSRQDWRLAIQLAARCGPCFIRADRCNEFMALAGPLRDHWKPGEHPAEVSGRYWLFLAFAGTKSAGVEAEMAARQALAVYRGSDQSEALYEALACAVLIGAQRGGGRDLQALVDEALRLERPEWPPALRSFLRWAMYRWHRHDGRHEQALASASEQAELCAKRDPLFAMQVSGTNVVEAEISLGHPDRAQAHARAMLARLREAGIDDHRVGAIHEGLALALALSGRHAEALDAASDAYQRLAADGDDLRLLEPLALVVAAQGRAADAARIVGHVDAALVANGITRWPAASQRRDQLQAALMGPLTAAAFRAALDDGAAMARARVFELAFASPG